MSEDLPRANVKRIVKSKMLELATEHFGSGKTLKDLPVHKDAVLAFSESAKIFIHYLSAAANDICRESKRQTINAEDVLKAVEEVEFSEFVEPLRTALEEYRKEALHKKAQKQPVGKTSGRKRKVEENSNQNGTEEEARQEEADDVDEPAEEKDEDEDDGSSSP